MEEIVIIGTGRFIWLLLSDIDALKRENDRLNLANWPLKVKCESQKTPRAMFMEMLFSYTHRTDHAKDQAWNLIIRVENF